MTANKHLPKYLLLLGTLIVLVGMLLRFPNLLELPLYVDETQHIYRSQRIAIGEVFEGVDQNKWLFSLTAGAFFARGQETIFIARAVSVLSGAVTIATCIAIGKALSNKWAGLVAGLFYAVFPFGIFFERQALVDPMLTMFTTLVIALSIVVARKPRWWTAALLMLSLAGAYLTKTAGLPYYVMPFIALVLYIHFDEYGWLVKLGKASGYMVVAVVLSLWVRSFFYNQAALAGVEPRDTHTATLENTVFGSWSDPDIQVRFYRDLGLMLQMIIKYAGPVILLLGLLGLVWLIRSKQQRSLLYIMAPAFGLLWVPMLAARPTFWSFPPRYFMTSGPPLAILAAISLIILLGKLKQGHLFVAWGALILVAAQGIVFTVLAASTPNHSLLAFEDNETYSYHDLAYRAAGQAVVEQWENGSNERAHILFHGITHQLTSVYVGNHIGDGNSLWEHPRELRESIMPRVVAGDAFYVVETDPWGWPAPLEEMPYGNRLEYIGSYGHPLAPISMNLYRVTGFSGQIAEAAYSERVPDPDKLRADAEALASAINGASERTVIVFPVRQAEQLAALIDYRVRPLVLDVYPPARSEVEREFASYNLGEDGDPLDVVMIEEAQIDAERTVQTVLQENYYFAGDEWYNLHHRLLYYTGPSDPQMDTVNARFEGGIILKQAAILDEADGEAVRLALAWETPAPIGDPFNIFVHLVDADGQVVAQYDRQPGNDLLPMTVWVPNEAIVDRVALPIHAALAPGTYQIYVGIYQPGGGLRLPVLDAPEAGPDYVVLGRVSTE